MKKETYYNLLKDYQALIIQKQFNPYLCNTKKLHETKNALITPLKHFILQTTADCIDEQKRYSRAGFAPTGSKREEKRERLISLMTKIKNEDSITEVDYAETYCEEIFAFGLTFPRFLIIVLIVTVLTILYKLITA